MKVWPRSPSSRGLTDVFGCGGISCLLFDFSLRTHTACCKYEVFSLLIYRSNWDEAKPRERLGRDCFSPIGQKCLFTPGCVCTWFHDLVNLCPSVGACETFVVFTHCESGTSPISITPESMEAGEYGLTRWTCSDTRRVGVAAVAELLWT